MRTPVRITTLSPYDARCSGNSNSSTRVAGRSSPGLRRDTGLNADFDTETDSSLGGNALVLRPTLALRWDDNERLNPGNNVVYNSTPQEEQDNDVSALELQFPFVFKLTGQWSGIASYKPKWNFLSESDRHRLEVGATRM